MSFSSTIKYIILIGLCLSCRSFRWSSAAKPQQHKKHLDLRLLASSSSNFVSKDATESFSLVTFNVLAPCYKKLANIPETTHIKGASVPSGSVDHHQRRIFESEYPELYVPRNELICQQLLQTQADIICLQEYWAGSADIQQLYYNSLCRDGGYELRKLERTSHWRSRGDGLAIFVKKDRMLLEDVREILYHDCGDRVALMLVLCLLPSAEHSSKYPPQRFICANTHLLFPHNEYSTKIRLREVTKLLGFIESYKQKELCSSICGRADVRLPVLIAGDFNGSPKGSVFQFMQSQNFRSALQEACINSEPGSSVCSTALADTLSNTLANDAQPFSKKWSQWISHRSHRGTDVAVDHVFYLNPSEQTPERLPPLPDWTNLVFFEVFQRILAEFGADNMRDAFSRFDQDSSNYITREEFSSALARLGFFGENSPALTAEELDVLVASADKNDDGMIDYKEFYDRFWLAAETVAMEKTPIEQERLLLAAETRSLDQQQESFNRSQTTALNKNTAGLLLNGKRFSFARSKWLLQKNIISKNSDATNSNDSVYESIETNDFEVEEMEASILPDAVNMGDIQVQQVQLFPEELEQGVWPANYTISDHGIVLCRFIAQLRPGIEATSVSA